MNISFINGGLDITDEVKTKVESRMRLALSRYSSKVARLTVELSPTDNPDKKKCRIELYLRPTRMIVAEDADDDLEVVIDRATAQIARSVERKIRRDRNN